MSIKKQSIVMLAGLATALTMTSAIAFEGAVADAPPAAVQAASSAFSSTLANQHSYVPCSIDGLNQQAERVVNFNLNESEWGSGLPIPASAAYSYIADRDFILLFNATGNCSSDDAPTVD